MFKLLSTRIIRSPSSKLMSIQLAPSLYSWKKLVHPKCKVLHLPLLNYMRFLFLRFLPGGSISAACQGLSEWQSYLPAYWLLPQFGIIHELADIAFCPFDQVINGNILNSICLTISLWVLPCIPSCQSDLCHSSHFEFSGPANFPPTLQSTCPNHLSPVLAIWIS